MKQLDLLDILVAADRSFKIVMGLLGCLLAPLGIWAGLLVILAKSLDIPTTSNYSIGLGLQLLSAGIIWQTTTYFTFNSNIDVDE